MSFTWTAAALYSLYSILSRIHNKHIAFISVNKTAHSAGCIVSCVFNTIFPLVYVFSIQFFLAILSLFCCYIYPNQWYSMCHTSLLFFHFCISACIKSIKIHKNSFIIPFLLGLTHCNTTIPFVSFSRFPCTFDDYNFSLHQNAMWMDKYEKIIIVFGCGSIYIHVSLSEVTIYSLLLLLLLFCVYGRTIGDLNDDAFMIEIYILLIHCQSVILIWMSEFNGCHLQSAD